MRLLLFLLISIQICAQQIDHITIAILAKDKAATLPLYLECIEAQTWPKNKTYLYVRTNNNNDNSAEVLRSWLDKVALEYAGVYFDMSDLSEPVQEYGNHEWNGARCKVLARLRQHSICWAFARKSHYFVVDCDNFIKPDTLQQLYDTQLPVVAPLLTRKGVNDYANYHAAVDNNGYYAYTESYFSILHRQIKGLIQVPLVHCTYFIRYEYLPNVVYDDQSYRYEYVIFSDFLRRQGVLQYLDNRQEYGYVSFATTSQELAAEPWIQHVYDWFKAS